MNSDGTAPRTPVEDGALNAWRGPLRSCIEQWADFILALDFKITPHCNSGIFVRTSPLTPGQVRMSASPIASPLTT
jgi:hypothetical protein